MTRVRFDCYGDQRGRRLVKRRYFDGWDEAHQYLHKVFPGECKKVSIKVVGRAG
ncbi:MAG: hypothetical protein F7B59_08335 [Desulfurococcales archaeon]|nr:hypothetical protein [Desulfurococcales archaeon]